MNSDVTAPWTVVHDFLFVHGGAEVVTKALAQDVLGGAPVSYVAGDPQSARDLGLTQEPRPLLSPRLFNEKTFRAFTPLYPRLLRAAAPIEGNVVASSYAFAHHVACTGRNVVYCHSPLRQVWSGFDHYAKHGSWSSRVATRGVAGYVRRQDLKAATRADLYIATGQPVADRIERYYGLRDVPVVTPPVDDEVFWPRHVERGDFYLWVGRITEPYKRLGLVLEAFADMPGRRLVVAGDGPDLARLRRTATPNVEFLGWQSKEQLALLFSSAGAVLFSSEDDFGLVPVEAMACGAPIIALRAGGATTTVAEGVTGSFYETPTSSALVAAIREHESRSWDEDEVIRHAQQFGIESFTARMREVLQLVPERTR